MVDVKGFSPRYTAPEVFGRMTSSITTATIEHEMKSDVYPYALILWEMMTRKIPWAHCMFFFKKIVIIVFSFIYFLSFFLLELID